MTEETLASSRFASGKTYGVLRAQVTADNGEYHSYKTDMSHYNLITTDDGPNETEQYQINIDIQSCDYANVKCVSFNPFSNDDLQISNLPYGFTPLRSDSDDSMALDLVRRPLFDLNLLTESSALSADEIAAKLDNYLKEVNPNVIVFGTKYDDRHQQHPNHYGLQRATREQKPSCGIDDVHLNQKLNNDGNAYQDGALFIETSDSDENNYVAFFFCFANQCQSDSDNDASN